MGWLRLVGSLKFYVSFAKEPYKRDYILQKRPIILKSLLVVATPYRYLCSERQSHRFLCSCIWRYLCSYICTGAWICMSGKNVYIYIYTCVYMYTYLYIYIYIHISMYVYIYIYICTNMFIYIYLYICIYIYIYIYVCIYIRPTHSMIYLHCLIASFKEIVLLIVQYK